MVDGMGDMPFEPAPVDLAFQSLQAGIEAAAERPLEGSESFFLKSAFYNCRPEEGINLVAIGRKLSEEWLRSSPEVRQVIRAVAQLVDGYAASSAKTVATERRRVIGR